MPPEHPWHWRNLPCPSRDAAYAIYAQYGATKGTQKLGHRDNKRFAPTKGKDKGDPAADKGKGGKDAKGDEPGGKKGGKGKRG